MELVLATKTFMASKNVRGVETEVGEATIVGRGRCKVETKVGSLITMLLL
jgi:hypothetical protein